MSKRKFFTITIFALLIGFNLQPAAAYAESDIAVVEKPFLEGRYDRAIYEAKRLIDERARNRHEIYYLKGLSELKLGRFDDARKSFDEIVSRYSKSSRAFDAHVGIGDAYFLEGNMNGAAKAYEEVKAKFPNDKNIAIVDARLNDCRKRGGSAQSSPPIESSLPVKSKPVAARQPDIVTPEIPQNGSQGYFSVQAGGFKNHRNAERLSAKLKAAGYASYVELPLADGDKLYRVKIGRFKTRSEAENTAAKLNRDGYRTKISDENPSR
ncbi:MAG: SPOR domain-containing protein [Candidatus Omnitrophica bacterium]|nr:SPOR domain-containing protein [Candidatus Omnitrophota bacterium]